MNEVQTLCDKGLDVVRELYLESFDNILHNQKVLMKIKNRVLKLILKN